MVGRRRLRRRIQLPSVRSPGPDINVTPLVDVVLVLLIIFMVVTPQAEETVDVQLAKEQTTERPADVAPEQVLVTVHRGALRINDESVDRSACLARLRALLTPQDLEQRVVFISASDETSYAELVEVIDAARAAGANEVGLVTEHMPGELDEGSP
jgi:biopolymer transport protein ExbD